MCRSGRLGAPGHAQFQLLDLPEMGQGAELGQRLRGQEAQAGGQGAVVAGHHQGVAAQVGDPAGIGQGLGQRRPQFQGPGGLAGGPLQQTLQGRVALAVFRQQLFDFDGDGISALISGGCIEKIG